MPRTQKLPLKEKNNKKSKRSKFLYPLDKFSYKLYFRIFNQKQINQSLSSLLDSSRIILFSPHQDDETLGCGGLLLASRGKATVQPVFATNGKGPLWARTEEEQLIEVSLRRSEAEQVCEFLGVKKPIHLGFDGIDVEKYNKLLIEKLSEEIERFNPSIIMTPFYTDAHPEHFWLTKNLAQVNSTVSKNVTILFYRVHGLIPQKFQNAYIGLSPELHQEKEDILSLYKSQDLHKQLVRSKYLLYSSMVPHHLSRKYKSIERYSMINFHKFRSLDQKFSDYKQLYKIRSLNYSPFSFRCFLLNELMFRSSEFTRYSNEFVFDTNN